MSSFFWKSDKYTMYVSIQFPSCEKLHPELIMKKFPLVTHSTYCRRLESENGTMNGILRVAENEARAMNNVSL